MATESRSRPRARIRSRPASTSASCTTARSPTTTELRREPARARASRFRTRERHRGRGRLPDLAAARGRDARTRRSRAASTISTASTRSRSARADGFAVLRDPIACKPAVLAETDDWVAMASEYRAIAVLPGAEDARRLGARAGARVLVGAGAGVSDRRSTTGRGRRPRGDAAARAQPAPARPGGRAPAPLAGDQPERRARRGLRARRRRSRSTIDGHVGYYCAGMNKLATVRVHGNAGVGAGREHHERARSWSTATRASRPAPPRAAGCSSCTATPRRAAGSR